MVSFPKVSHTDTSTHKHTQRAEGGRQSLIEKNQAERNLIAAVWPKGGAREREAGKTEEVRG